MAFSECKTPYYTRRLGRQIPLPKQFRKRSIIPKLFPAKPFRPAAAHISGTVNTRPLPNTQENLELDPDFTPQEHAEFAKLEQENPYVEHHEEKVPVPPLPKDARDGKHDVLFLLIFIILAALFLYAIIFGGGLH